MNGRFGDDIDGFAVLRLGLALHNAFDFFKLASDFDDDSTGRTLASASSVEKSIGASGANRDGAAAVGKELAARAKAVGVRTIVFDRGGFGYHGRVAALAEALREEGLEF